MNSIQTTDQLKEYLENADSDTLVIFDVDNTLIRPTTLLGSDEWLFYTEGLLRVKGISEYEVLKKAEAVWNEVQWLVDTHAVDPEIPPVLRKLQGRGIQVMGLTARISAAAQVTDFQLKSNGIDLSLSTIQPKRSVIPNSVFGTEDAPTFEKGILYIGETNRKGTVLEYFLQAEGEDFKKKKILFIDDKEKHVQSVSLACEKLNGVESICIRYSKTDVRAHPFIKATTEALSYFYSDPLKFEGMVRALETFSGPFAENLEKLFIEGELSDPLRGEVIERMRRALVVKF